MRRQVVVIAGYVVGITVVMLVIINWIISVVNDTRGIH